MPPKGLDKEGKRILLLTIEETSNNFSLRDLFDEYPEVFGPFSDKKLKQLEHKRRSYLNEKAVNPERYWSEYGDCLLSGDNSKSSSESDSDDNRSTSFADDNNSRSRENSTPASGSRATPRNRTRSRATPDRKPSSTRAATQPAHKNKFGSPPSTRNTAKTPPPTSLTMDDHIVKVREDRPEANFPFVITTFRDKIIKHTAGDKIIKRTAIDGFKICVKNVNPRDVHNDRYSLKFSTTNELVFTGPLVDATGTDRNDTKSKVVALKNTKAFCDKIDLEEQILVGHLNGEPERNKNEITIRFDSKTFLTTDHFLLSGDTDEYALFSVRYPFEYEWVKPGTEHSENPVFETKEGIMTDIFWLVAKMDAKNRELDDKPGKKLPKHLRGLSDRMTGMNLG